MNKKNTWNAPQEVTTPYIEKCKIFATNDDLFNTFKQDEDYTKILEGKEKIIGQECYWRMKNWYSNYEEFIFKYLEKFKENDIFGSPTLHFYPEIKTYMSPGTMKYISDTLNIFNFLENFKPKIIFEIGGGYGGMCKTISSVYNFDRYFMLDIPEPILLCKKYLNHFENIKNKIFYIDTDKFENIGDIDVDLVIADASLAECNLETQKYYTENILIKAKHGYIVYNTLHLEYGKVGLKQLISTLLENEFYIEEKYYKSILYLFFRKK